MNAVSWEEFLDLVADYNLYYSTRPNHDDRVSGIISALDFVINVATDKECYESARNSIDKLGNG